MLIDSVNYTEITIETLLNVDNSTYPNKFIWRSNMIRGVHAFNYFKVPDPSTKTYQQLMDENSTGNKHLEKN